MSTSRSREPRSLASPFPLSVKGGDPRDSEDAGARSSALKVGAEKGASPVPTEVDAVEDHFVYFLYDETNLREEQLNVAILNLGPFIKKLIPTKQRFHNSVKISVREKIKLSKPTGEILKQSFTEVLEKANAQLRSFLPRRERKGNEATEPYNYAYLLDGTRVKSLLDIEPSTQVVVLGREKFGLQGLKGASKGLIESEDVEKEVKNVVKNACSKWVSPVVPNDPQLSKK